MGFVVFVVYTLMPLGWMFARNVSGEDSGAEEVRYQEALDDHDLHVAEYQMNANSSSSRLDERPRSDSGASTQIEVGATAASMATVRGLGAACSMV
eukprot:470238-Prymnesium_polylepis.1